jgi:hypothetical protein
VGAIVGIVAAVAVVTDVVIHESSKKRTIAGCVSSGENGISVRDEKDKRITRCRATRPALGRVIESPCKERR